MRTAATLCASGAGIGLAAVGLAVVREEPHKHEPSRDADTEMTAVARYPPRTLESPFAFATPPATRSVSEGYNGKVRPGKAKTGQKRTLTPSASFSLGLEQQQQQPERENNGESPVRTPGTPSTRPTSWFRRFSSSMSSSRESSRTPTSRPGSAAVSHSNGSVAFSHTGSTTPIFSNGTPPSLPPNKLVKRASSVRSTSGSPLLNSGSKLPLPVFRRPATSHQRSTALQELSSSTPHDDRMSIDQRSVGDASPQLHQYFTPRVATHDWSVNKRRSFSGIPNPIKRVYPDRKYTPVLVSFSNEIRPAHLEAHVDDGLGSEEDITMVKRDLVVPSFASSPLPNQTAHFEEEPAPRRSFSISELLSAGPQPLWKRSSSTKLKNTGSKLVRKTRARVVSAPQAVMGNTLSASNDSERPAKRRELTDPHAAHRGIYSSSNSARPVTAPSNHEIELDLGTDAPHSQTVNTSFAVDAGETQHEQTPSPLEHRMLPPVASYNAPPHSVRVSAAHSDINSSLGSESGKRSVGEASTDYENDAFFDSYPTRTTRSSSGRRGPHIEAIFDDSPPDWSSGRSTRLKDILESGGAGPNEYSMRYRHSTIEEEGSMVSTPVRSVREQSVNSTPSALPGSQQLFTSSPPAAFVMPDPDEMNWDAPDDEMEWDGQRFKQPPISHATHVDGGNQPFRFASGLRQLQSPSVSTPSYHNTSDRANLFDWSEMQPSPGPNHSPQRPRTVHGKKDPETRGSRPPARRPPSGMHARSHSVPVVPDVDGKRNHVVANKFGTWGVGHKAVTEDWNEDFDFDEPPISIPESVRTGERRADSGHEMFVPRSIKEQQESVVANISLLREWGLLIEELKELRMRAMALDMMNGAYAESWREVDAMIELADQESEEQTLQPRRSPPSSPGFDYDDFEDLRDLTPNLDSSTEPHAHASMPPEAAWQNGPTIASARISNHLSTSQHASSARPRKDSEAVARSVIEALQSKRSVSDPASLTTRQTSKKVPFDTATLRHIVPYVNGLKRKIKDALRETEGLHTSPRRRASLGTNGADWDGDEPAFRSIFDGPGSNSTPTRRKSRRQQAETDHDGFEDFDDELETRMQNMNLPHR